MGRPNVGKSTLLNSILGEKIAAVSPTPQTTRKRVLGIRTTDRAQLIFIDTPGIHKPLHKLGDFMIREARASLEDADLILFLVEPEKPGRGDLYVLDLIRSLGKPVILLINKIDRVRKPSLLPLIDAWKELHPFTEIMPISALDGNGVEPLVDLIASRLPPGPQLYPDDVGTDQTERMITAEIIREKIVGETKDEVPHAVAVEISAWTAPPEGPVSVYAVIYVEREGQKGIIIGRKGALLKKIGTTARKEIEHLIGRKVYLELWVKARKDWRSDLRTLKELGYG